MANFTDITLIGKHRWRNGGKLLIIQPKTTSGPPLAEKHADKRKHKARAKYLSQSSFSEKDQSSVHMKRSAKDPF